MRGIARIALMGTLGVLMLAGALVAPASAGGPVALDEYCSPSGDYCTSVIEKPSGAIWFKIRAFADYFGRSEACVTKESRACGRRSPRERGGLFVWSIKWQGNYPDEGPGRYTLRWFDENGNRIGLALHFRPS
jgi:hypothetical protein